jgi:sialidase-1
MRQLCSCLVLLLSATCFAGGGEWHNSLKPKGAPAGKIEIVRDGAPVCAIEIPEKATEIEKKAAEELRHWITEITGAAPEILTGDKKGKMVRLATDPALGEEGYRIAIEDNNLVLTGGTTRGVVNAVYALLEEDLGCRFYTNESVRLPKSKSLVVEPVARQYVPRLRLRDPYYAAAFDATWSLRNRTNAPGASVPEDLGGRIDYDGMFVHTAAALVPAAKYFKDHPEYYMLDKAGHRSQAQLCATDPEVLKIATATVLETLKNNPHTEIISVSKNDSGGDQLCQCERCKKLRDSEGGAEMANQLVLVNGIAEAVEKQYPSVVIDTLAYLDTISVPKTMRPRKNVAIRLCNDTVGAWGTPFKIAANCPVAPIAKAWAAAHNRIYIWDYNVNFSHYFAPMPNIDVMAANIRFWVENNAEGVMLQGGYQGPAEDDELKCWVTSKLLWDPSRDENALVQDFVWGHYGSAAPSLAAYEALLSETKKQHAKETENPPGGIRYPMDAAFLSKDFVTKATELFAAAKKQAQGDEKLTRRVERAELPILYVKCMRGPEFVGADYGKVVAEFERIARREKIQYLEEGGPTLEPKLAAWKAQIPKPSSANKVISKGKEAYSYQAFPDACRLANGDILCVFYAGYTHVSLAADDFPNGGRICMVRSSDEGKTWSDPAVLFDDADDNRDSHIAQLSDGSLVCTFFSWKNKEKRLTSYKDFSWKLFNKVSENTGAQMVRSTDNGKTWEKSAQSIAKDWVCSAPVRQMPDGKCLLGLYGEVRHKPSVGAVIQSDDLCKSWNGVVKMPQPEGLSLDAETDLIRLKDGRLYAALRSSKQNMHYSISSDEGQSWSMATDIGFKGHCPHLNRLSTGEIILSHRLPNTSIHISRDECKTWQGPYEIDTCIGAYPATVQLKDGSVLIVYYSEGEGSEIRAKRFKVNEKGIEMLAWG